MPPAALAGNCQFSEKGQRTRVFALCEMTGDPVLKPVSVVGDPAIRGIRIGTSERVLALQVGRLPATMVRAFIGLSVTQGHSLVDGSTTAQGPFELKLTLDSGAGSALPMRPAPSQSDRYALLAVVTRRGVGWVVSGLAPREYYPDRRALAAIRHVPTWWSQHA